MIFLKCLIISGRSHTHFLRLPLQIYHLAGWVLFLAQVFLNPDVSHATFSRWIVVGSTASIASLLHFGFRGFWADHWQRLKIINLLPFRTPQHSTG